MKFGLLYDRAIESSKTTKDREAKEPKITTSPADDAARVQMKVNWLASTATEQTVKSLHIQYDDLVASSIVLAVSYPSHNNHHQIIQNLVRASELLKTIEQITKI